MFSEQASLVRSALSRIVSSVAKLSFPQGTWPQLMQVTAHTLLTTMPLLCFKFLCAPMLLPALQQTPRRVAALLHLPQLLQRSTLKPAPVAAASQPKPDPLFRSCCGSCSRAKCRS